MSSIVIINGSPRKNGNTAKMYKAFLEGIKSESPEATVTVFDLYDYDYKGCRSCFACKLKDSKTYGQCAVNDSLKPLIKEASAADILVLASPIYLMDISAQMKAFLERLIFPYATYEAGYKIIAPKKCQVVTIYTMNVPKEMFPEHIVGNIENFIGHVFSHPKRLCAYNTYQFADYSKYSVEVFDESEKRKYRETTFPTELDSAYQLGKELGKLL